MEKLDNNSERIREHSPFSEYDRKKEKVSKSFLKNAGVFIGSFLCIVCILTLITDIDFRSFVDVKDFGAELFVLMFCSYTMYICLYDSGKREGLTNPEYISIVNRYHDVKANIYKLGIEYNLSRFINRYITDELRYVRADILACVGITVEQFDKLYLPLDKKSVRKNKALSKRERTAIIDAMRVQPLHLTPGMFLRRGRGGKGRSPLGIDPDEKRNRVFIRRFLVITITTLLTISLAFEVIQEPTLEVITMVLIKILPVVLNGFLGYKFGYDNTAYDRTYYISDQIDFLLEFEASETSDTYKMHFNYEV